MTQGLSKTLITASMIIFNFSFQIFIYFIKRTMKINNDIRSGDIADKIVKKNV